MNFRSDNEAPVAKPILEAICSANEGSAKAYGADDYSQQLNALFAEVFETDCRVFPVATGTAANSMGLAHICPPYGGVLCNQDAHIMVDECGAPEFFGNGLKLLGLAGTNGKLTASALEKKLGEFGVKGDHEPLPRVVSVTQATEWGTVYSVEELADIQAVCRANELRLHMDGARFANAVVYSGASPAELTWKSGVEVLSFGATKNGAMAAEVVVFFRPELAEQFGRRRMKGGHLFSKMRYLACQWQAYFDNDLWLDLARRANDTCQKLADVVMQHNDVLLEYPAQANELFIRLPEDKHKALQQAGFEYYPWPGEPGLYRLVVPWNVSSDCLEAFSQALAD